MSEYIVNMSGDWANKQGEKLTEIVRCRDCKYNAKDTDGICYRFDHEHFNQPDGFCAWAERKEDGETLFMACLNSCDFTPEQAIAATLGNHEIVRCRDCKYGIDSGKYCAEGCADSWDWRNVEPDGFCAWGERSHE